MKKRNGMIDLMKFVYIVVIFLFHGSKNLTSKTLFPCASITVEFFFLVSGYLMARSASKQSFDNNVGYSTFNYICNKVRHYLPNYYIAWIIAFVATEVFGKVKIKKALKNIIMSVPELTFITSSGLMGVRFNSATWYISAMTLAMLLLFPLSAKLKESFNSVIAPAVSLFIYAYMYQNFKQGISSPAVWVGFMTKGLLRAFAAISLGCFCHHVVSLIKEENFSKLSVRIILTFVEMAIYGTVLYACKGYGDRKLDYILIIFLAVGIVISFSNKTLSSIFLNNKLVYWLGEFSFNLFLSHGFWSHCLKKPLASYDFSTTMIIYGIISLSTAIFVMYSSKIINTALTKNKEKHSSIV